MRNNLEKRAADPPPLAPARLQQGRWIWDSASPLVVTGFAGDPPGRGTSACLMDEPEDHYADEIVY